MRRLHRGRPPPSEQDLGHTSPCLAITRSRRPRQQIRRAKASDPNLSDPEFVELTEVDRVEPPVLVIAVLTTQALSPDLSADTAALYFQQAIS
ncbi:hypothetical protein M6B38_314890 [Iris pallida]|uniref:Uncharacterized protein n=1 Tax=Iris pallida TaxID=29817 RepID=A0AAX6HFC7_IRIPA|nr:hypothetical protein M6B38_314890 [Iris pallida]